MKTFKIIAIISTLILCANSGNSQSVTFKVFYPGTYDFSGDKNNVVCKPYNNDNSFLISGSFGNMLLLFKINSTGNLISTKEIIYIGDYCNILFNNDTTFTLYSFAYNNNALLKLDTSLNIISSVQYDSIAWYQAYNRNIICLTINNGFLISGGKGILMPVIVKIDSLHNVLWGKYFTPIQGCIQDMIQTKDSGFAIATNLTNATASLIKTDKNGNVLWAKSYFRPHGYIHNVLENSDGTMIITGNIDNSSASSPLFFVKLDQLGNVIWAKTFGNTVNNIENLHSCTKHTQDGGYITLATITKNNEDLLLIKTDTVGDTLWTRDYGSPGDQEYGQSVEQLNDKGYIIAGMADNHYGFGAYIIRTDSLGHTSTDSCEEHFPTVVVNNITVNDSIISVTSVPFTVTTSTVDTSTQSITLYEYDACLFDNIKEITDGQTELIIYPNPANNKLNINIKEPAEVEIINDIGKTVMVTSIDCSTKYLDISGFSSGIYFIRVKTGKSIAVKKFIKE